MAVFFFLIGLEIKREIMEGELSSFRPGHALPGMGALGGMLVPACNLYLVQPWAMQWHWTAGRSRSQQTSPLRWPCWDRSAPACLTSLKVFLLTLAILDDLAAITIIALFYSADLSPAMLLVGGIFLIIAVAMNRMGVTRTSTYVLLGAVLWVAVLKSGVHATLAGVLIAFCVPIRDKEGHCPLRELEHNLHGPVAYAILPVFAFRQCRAVRWRTRRSTTLAHPVTLGVVSGLALGQATGNPDFHGPRRCPGPGAAAERRQLDPASRRCLRLRHRLHHEPVHRRPGL